MEARIACDTELSDAIWICLLDFGNDSPAVDEDPRTRLVPAPICGASNYYYGHFGLAITMESIQALGQKFCANPAAKEHHF